MSGVVGSAIPGLRAVPDVVPIHPNLLPTHSSREKFYGVKAEFWVMENIGSC